MHREVKPSNILLFTQPGGGLTAKLGDFGIAQDTRQRKTTLLPGAGHPGTPLYMAPEQADVSLLLDNRADIFALGVTLWEMLTGEDYKALLRDGAGPTLQSYSPAASPGIARVIARAVRPNREERYQTPRELAEDLRRVPFVGLRGLTVEPPPVTPTSTPIAEWTATALAAAQQVVTPTPTATPVAALDLALAEPSPLGQAMGGPLPCQPAAGTVATETRQVDPFTALAISGTASVEVRQGDQESLQVQADAALLPLLASEAQDGRLTLAQTGCVAGGQGPRYTLRGDPAVTRTISGVGSVERAAGP